MDTLFIDADALEWDVIERAVHDNPWRELVYISSSSRYLEKFVQPVVYIHNPTRHFEAFLYGYLLGQMRTLPVWILTAPTRRQHQIWNKFAYVHIMMDESLAEEDDADETKQPLLAAPVAPVADDSESSIQEEDEDEDQDEEEEDDASESEDEDASASKALMMKTVMDLAMSPAGGSLMKHFMGGAGGHHNH
jgi:hypothetical protein